MECAPSTMAERLDSDQARIVQNQPPFRGARDLVRLPVFNPAVDLSTDS